MNVGQNPAMSVLVGAKAVFVGLKHVSNRDRF